MVNYVKVVKDGWKHYIPLLPRSLMGGTGTRWAKMCFGRARDALTYREGVISRFGRIFGGSNG